MKLWYWERRLRKLTAKRARWEEKLTLLGFEIDYAKLQVRSR